MAVTSSVSPRRWLLCLFAVSCEALSLEGQPLEGDPVLASDYQSLADMSLEDLVSMEVFTAASLLPTQTSKAPGTVYSFSGADFERFGVRRLDDLLQFVPGFQVNQYRKRHKSIWARGLLERYNDKFVLLVDGIRQQHLYYGHFSLGDNFPLERIEKVEIILGPASSLYGANAFSGLISVTTKSFSDEPTLELTAELGDNDRAKISALYNSSRVQAFGSYLEQEAPFRDDRKSFIGLDAVQPLDEDYQSLHLKLRPVDGVTMMLDYSASETPFVFIPSDENAFVEARTWSAAMAYEVGEVETGRLEANAYYQDDDAREIEREQLTQRLGYEEYQNATMSGVSVTGFRRLGAHTLATGVSWRHEQADKVDFTRAFDFNIGFLATAQSGSLLSDTDIENDDYAVFLQDVWGVSDKLEVTFGARYDEFDQFDEYFNYRAAAVYTPKENHTWKFLYGTAIRTPSFREYLKVLEGTTYQAPVPDAESVKSVELGYLFSGPSVSINITAFHNKFDDFIREMPTPNGADEYFSNSSSDLTLQGVEGLLGYNPTERLSLRLSAAYVDPDTSEFSSLPYIASWTGSFNLGYELAADHQVGFSLVFNSSRSDVNSFDQDRADEFVLSNFYAFGKISPTVSYRFGIDNVFDEKVYDPAADFGGQYNNEKSTREVWLSLQWTPVL